jgi:hypothetical protein
MQDLQLPPAFCLSQTQLVARAIELAYERDYSHIPYVSFLAVCLSALDIGQRGLTRYIPACNLRKQPAPNGVCSTRAKRACCAILYGCVLIPSTNPMLRPAT